MLLSFQLWYCVWESVFVSVLITKMKAVCVYVYVHVCSVIILEVIQRSFPLTILPLCLCCITVPHFSFSPSHVFTVYVCIYAPIYCVGVEEDSGHFLMPKWQHQQWFVSLIRQSEVTLLQQITSISLFYGCVCGCYCVLINSSKTNALFGSKQSLYKI